MATIDLNVLLFAATLSAIALYIIAEIQRRRTHGELMRGLARNAELSERRLREYIASQALAYSVRIVLGQPIPTDGLITHLHFVDTAKLDRALADYSKATAGADPLGIRGGEIGT